ncbi:MAG: hypothetical protein R3Y32_05845 [Bacillota bacterium]
MGKKSNKEYRMEVGDDGKPIKVYIEPAPIEYEVAEEVAVRTNFFNELKVTKYPEKSQFTAIVLAVFGGMISLHDFYLGTKYRAGIKGIVFLIGAIMAWFLFDQVSKETALSYNVFYQSIMLLPLILYFLAWSYDFITLAAKRSSHFKVKPIKEKANKKSK